MAFNSLNQTIPPSIVEIIVLQELYVESFLFQI